VKDIIDRIRNAGFTPPNRGDIQPFANFKRFLERWRADKQFRASFPGDPHRVAAAFGLKADPEEVRPFWDKKWHLSYPPRVERFLALYRELYRRRDADRRDEAPADSRYAKWRQRQRYRLNLEVGASLSGNPHLAASYELSRGCSVGCWFCSSSPPKLTDLFRYTPENGQLWRGVLEAVRTVSGPALAKSSICYSGTDPFDNPDYERFLEDFTTVNGDTPYTSTALPVRDPERTRKLIAICGPNRLRFSVLSVGMLNKIHAAFTAEELLLVELGLRNEGSVENHLMNFAGRAREREKTYRKYRPGEPLINTPSCETGFKFNLVDRVIQLSSPCAPDDRWPMGDRVYAEASFTDADDVRRILEEMIARHMPVEVSDRMPLRFQRHLQYEQTAEGFNLTTVHLRQRFDASDAPFMKRLGELVQPGRYTAGQITDILAANDTALRETVCRALHELFRLGLFDDEPAALHVLAAVQ
jgi:radical SAM family RiPP maturation amino acid epimerase